MYKIKSWLSGIVIGSVLAISACSDSNNDNNFTPVPPPTVKTLTLKGYVSSVQGAGGLNNAQVKLYSADGEILITNGITNSNGEVSLNIAKEFADKDAVVRISKDLYVEQALPIHTNVNDLQNFKARLLTVGKRIVATDFEKGGTFAGSQGAAVIVQADSFVDESGAPVTGEVNIDITPLNVGARPDAFPGSSLVVGAADPSDPNSEIVPALMVSGGMVNYQFSQNGNQIKLAEGKTAKISMPLFIEKAPDGSALVADSVVPIWAMDSKTGIWKEEGKGDVVYSADAPESFAVVTEASHFSWWNVDWAMPVYMVAVIFKEQTTAGLLNYTGDPISTYIRFHTPAPSTQEGMTGVYPSVDQSLATVSQRPGIVGINELDKLIAEAGENSTVPGLEKIIGNKSAMILLVPKLDFTATIEGSPKYDNGRFYKSFSKKISYLDVVDAINNDKPLEIILEWGDVPSFDIVAYPNRGGEADVTTVHPKGAVGGNDVLHFFVTNNIYGFKTEWEVKAAATEGCPATALGTVDENGVYQSPSEDEIGNVSCKVEVFAKFDWRDANNVLKTLTSDSITVQVLVSDTLTDSFLVFNKWGTTPYEDAELLGQIKANNPELNYVFLPKKMIRFNDHGSMPQRFEVNSSIEKFKASRNTLGAGDAVLAKWSLRCAVPSPSCDALLLIDAGTVNVTFPEKEYDYYSHIFIIKVIAQDDPRQIEEFLYFGWGIEFPVGGNGNSNV